MKYTKFVKTAIAVKIVKIKIGSLLTAFITLDRDKSSAF